MTSDPILEPPHGGEGWRGEIAATLALAWPLVLANLAQMLVYSVDVIFVARLGADALAASSLAVSMFGIIAWSATGMTGMVAALIAAELGRRRHAVREVRRSARMGLWLAVAAGTAAMGLMHFGKEILVLTGQDPQVAERAGKFLAVLKWAVVPMLVANVLRNFVSALGRPIFATAITMLAIGVAVLGNYTFVFGHFGVPAMGLLGSPRSTVLTSLFFVAAYVVAIARDRRLRRYRVFGNWWRPEWSRLGELVRKGFPVSLTILAEAGLFTGGAFLMGRIGPEQLAGHTIAMQLASFAFMVPLALGQAATIRVGYFFGARDRTAIGRAGWSAIMLGGGFMLVSASVMLFAPRALISLYVDPDAPKNALLVGFALRFIMIAAAFQLFDGTQTVCAGCLRGLQDTRIPMLLALFGYWLPGFGTSIALGLFTPLRGIGVWIGFAVGLFVVAALLLRRWTRRDRLATLST